MRWIIAISLLCCATISLAAGRTVSKAVIAVPFRLMPVAPTFYSTRTMGKLDKATFMSAFQPACESCDSCKLHR